MVWKGFEVMDEAKEKFLKNLKYAVAMISDSCAESQPDVDNRSEKDKGSFQNKCIWFRWKEIKGRKMVEHIVKIWRITSVSFERRLEGGMVEK